MATGSEAMVSRTERRHRPRVQVAIPAYYRVLNRQQLRPTGEPEEPFRACIQNLGMGGALLLVDRKISMQAVVSLDVDLPDLDLPVRSLAEVKHVRETPLPTFPYAVGVEFLSISRQDTQSVKDFVSGRLN